MPLLLPCLWQTSCVIASIVTLRSHLSNSATDSSFQSWLKWSTLWSSVTEEILTNFDCASTLHLKFAWRPLSATQIYVPRNHKLPYSLILSLPGGFLPQVPSTLQIGKNISDFRSCKDIKDKLFTPCTRIAISLQCGMSPVRIYGSHPLCHCSVD